MNNPINTGVGFELYPAPDGCTGHRLWKLLTSRTGASRHQYLDTFERVNLVRGLAFDKIKAKARAYDLTRKYEGTGRTIVLLGQDVRAAFGHPRLLIHPQVIGGCTWRQIPHPSGRNLFYNDADNVKLVELLLEELFVQYHQKPEERAQ